MIEAFSTRRNRIRTLILLAISGLSAIGAALVGIDDNLSGVLLAFLVMIALVLAFAHPWRTSRQFWRLLFASTLVFVVFGLLHNVLEGAASMLGGAGPIQTLLEGAGAVFFLIAFLVCPAGMLVGAVGAVAMSIRNRHRPTPGPTTTG